LAFWDFLPTAAEVAGAEPPGGLDGISFMPALTGDRQETHEFMYWGLGAARAVRMGPWKAVRGRKKLAGGAAWELYDLRTDAGEKRDVAGANGEVVARIESYAKAAVRPAAGGGS
jgi:arylsulfatase A-like enzyme